MQSPISFALINHVLKNLFEEHNGSIDVIKMLKESFASLTVMTLMIFEHPVDVNQYTDDIDARMFCQYVQRVFGRDFLAKCHQSAAGTASEGCVDTLLKTSTLTVGTILKFASEGWYVVLTDRNCACDCTFHFRIPAQD